MKVNCHICDEFSLMLMPEYAKLCRVTSDSKPWKKAGQLGICQHCGAVQKVIDVQWQLEVKEIYDRYNMYLLSDGQEQVVFAQDSGTYLARSDVIINNLIEVMSILPIGRLLDIGCGNGAWLKVFSRKFPNWRLAGTEWNDQNKEQIEKIQGVEQLYNCSPESVPGSFDVISMIHVLEHIPRPKAFLERLREKLNNSGLLVIGVPHYRENPFDLLVADHCAHYSLGVLKNLLIQSGYEIIVATDQWVAKELTVVARKTERVPQCKKYLTDNMSALIVKDIEWLTILKEQVQKIAKKPNFGLFGTGIAATWLFIELDGQTIFFVDEAQYRVGKTYMGKPVYSPDDMPKNGHVFIALPSKIAETVQKRLSVKRTDITYWVPSC